jgi:hypothetical protein
VNAVPWASARVTDESTVAMIASVLAFMWLRTIEDFSASGSSVAAHWNEPPLVGQDISGGPKVKVAAPSPKSTQA